MKLLLVCVLLLGAASAALSTDYAAFGNDTACAAVGLVPVADQCRFVTAQCATPEYQIGVFDYLRLYYCPPLRTLAAAFTVVVLLLCFVSLALTASDYLCPNLYAISKFLDLSDNLAGLTLLAVGNGSADVVSTFKALNVGSAGLAVSELVGAALFILTVVVGSISIASPFRVPKHHFVRDTAFYLTVSVFITATLLMGRLTYYSAVLLFSIYIIYVMVAIYSHSWLKESARKQLSAARIRSNYDDSQESPHHDYSDGLSHLPLIEVLSTYSDEEQDVLNEFESYLSTHPHHTHEERAPIETGSYGLRILLRELSKHSVHQLKLPSSLLLTNERPLTVPSSPVAPVEEERAASPDTSYFPDQQEEKTDPAFWRTLLPDWDPADSWLSLVGFVLFAPANLCLKLSTPNREKAIEYVELASTASNAFTFKVTDESSELLEDYLFANDVLLFRIQLAVSLSFLELVYFFHAAYFWVFFPVSVAFFVALTYAVPTTEPKLSNTLFRYRLCNYAGSFIGFVVSLTWISIFATEIVAILKATAVVLEISDDILGSTVFALGNSVGDLVSNLTIAKMGMPVMAFGACFGGPLLGLCSLGLTSFIVMSDDNLAYISIKFSSTLKLNCCALIATLVFISIYVPRNNWMFDRRVGFILIFSWVISVVATIIVELA